MTKLITRFMKDESGATAIEYGLIAALIGLAVVSGATLVGGHLDSTFDAVGNALKGADETDYSGT